MSDLWPQLLRFWSFQDRAVQTAAAGVLMLAVSCGVLGCFIVLRRLSLLGDSLGHAVLPGVCLGFLVTETKNPWWIFVGALGAALLGSLLIAVIQRNSKLKPDVAMGLVLSGFFGLGIVLLTYLQTLPSGGQSGLNQFLFGQASAISERDLWLIGTVTLVIVGTVLLAYKELTLTSFDEQFAGAIGLPTRTLHYLLMLLTALAIVISLQAVGVVLLSALLITPAATALLLTDRLPVMIGLSVLLAAFGGLLGLNVSYLSRSLPTGPFVVVALSACFALAWLFSPRSGVVVRALRVHNRKRQTSRENLLKRLYQSLTEPELAASAPKYMPLVDLSSSWNTPVARLRGLLQPLKLQGWIELADRDVRLTDLGVSRAKELIRNFQLWEQFLTEEVHLPADHTARDAEDIEHLLTPELAEQLASQLQSARSASGTNPPN